MFDDTLSFFLFLYKLTTEFRKHFEKIVRNRSLCSYIKSRKLKVKSTINGQTTATCQDFSSNL